MPLAKPWPTQSARRLWQHYCQKDLWWFVMIAGGAAYYMRDTPKDRSSISRRFHGQLIDWLQHHIDEWFEWRRLSIKRQKKLLVIIFRFGRKSLLITRLADLWIQTRDTDASTAVGSEDIEMAKSFLTGIKAVLDGSDKYARYTWLYGLGYSPNRTWDRMKCVHALRQNMAIQDPSFFTWSVRAGLTSTHPDVIVMDDPLSEEKIKEDEGWIDTSNRAIQAASYAFRTDALFMVPLTRKRDTDFPGTILPKEGVKTWTGQSPPSEAFEPRKNGQWDVFFHSVEDDQRESVVPEIISTEALREKEAGDPLGYAQEYLCNPAVGRHMPITLEHIEKCYVDPPLSPEFYRDTDISFHLDTAFKDPSKIGSGDDSVLVIQGTGNDGVVTFLEAHGNNRHTDHSFALLVIEHLQKYENMGARVRRITDEKPASKSGAWFTYLKTLCGTMDVRCPETIEFSRGNQKKESRLRYAAAFFTSGHVRLLRGAPGLEQLVRQALRIGMKGHDDFIDAFSDAFHPDIYRTARASIGDENTSYILSPGDEELLGEGSSRESYWQRRARKLGGGDILDSQPDEVFNEL